MISGKQIAIIGVIITVIFLIGTAKFDWNLFRLIPMVAYGGAYTPEYPFPPFDKLFSPVFGTVDCKDTGLWSTVDQPIPIKQKFYSPNCGGGSSCEKMVVDYTCQSYGGCQIASLSATCPSLWPNPIYSVKVGGVVASYPYSATYGQGYHIEIACKDGGVYGLAPTSTNIAVQGKVMKLYVTSWGYTPGGWMAGSEGCKLLSADAETLKKMQPIDPAILTASCGAVEGKIQGVDIIPPGSTKCVIVGWREDPAFGTVNPQGQYEGKDVICRPYSEIASIKKVGTYGGYNYWVKDQTLVTYSSKPTMCCDNTNCAGGYVCEKYTCTAKPTECTYGSCAWSVDQCGVSGSCIEKEGSYYIQTWTCDSNKCCQPIKTYQKCCQSTCDRISTPTEKYICNPTVGCEKIEILKDCGTGYCCNVPGENQLWTDATKSSYKTQSCINKKCCYENPGDMYRGVCKDVCYKPPKVCGNGICEEGENIGNCPQDCGQPPSEFSWAIIFALIGGVLSFLMLGANALREKDWVGIAIAGTIALIVGIVIWWVISNWVMIAISLGILALLGGLGLYFFGGAILAVVVILMLIIRTIKGD